MGNAAFSYRPGIAAMADVGLPDVGAAVDSLVSSGLSAPISGAVQVVST